MPITTIFDSNKYLESVLKILSEFVLEHIPGISVVIEKPVFDETNIELAKPTLYLEIMPGRNFEVGMGGIINKQGDKGQEKTINIMAYWFTTNTASGMNGTLDVINKAQTLEMAFNIDKTSLQSAGLINPQISNFRQIPGEILKGGRQLITCKVLLKWS